MKFTDRVKIAFTGTPEEFTEWAENRNLSEAPVAIIADSGDALIAAIRASTNYQLEFENLRNSETAMLLVKGAFSYGFDVEDEDGDDIEVLGNNATFNFVELYDLFGDAAPVPLEVEKVVAVALPDVSEITTDDLIKVVLNYDIIHESAKAELTKRLQPIAEKAKIMLDAEGKKA